MPPKGTDKPTTRGRMSQVGQRSTGASPLKSQPTDADSDNGGSSLMTETMLARIYTRLDKLDGVEESLVDLKNTMNEMRDTSSAELTRLTADVTRLTEKLDSIIQERVIDKRNIQVLQHQLTMALDGNRRLELQVNDMDNRTRLRNLRLDGKPEEGGEDLRAYVMGLGAFLRVSTAGEEAAIQDVYRIGKAPTHRDRMLQPQRPRSILIVFRDEQTRHEYYQCRMKLKGSGNYDRIYISDDVTPLTRKLRDEYRSVAELARRGGAEVRIHTDGIVLNGRKYKHADAALLPTEYTLTKAKTVKLEGELYFQSEHSFLSNFAPSPITQGTATYHSAEQMYQSAKCQALGDTDRLTQVMAAPTPLQAKRIADQLKPTQAWQNQCEGAMTKVLREKFGQNPMLAEKLLQTGNLTLNEATSNSFFGIGASLHSREIKDKSYKGMNKLGKALMSLRTELGVAQRQQQQQ